MVVYFASSFKSALFWKTKGKKRKRTDNVDNQHSHSDESEHQNNKKKFTFSTRVSSNLQFSPNSRMTFLVVGLVFRHFSWSQKLLQILSYKFCFFGNDQRVNWFFYAVHVVQKSAQYEPDADFVVLVGSNRKANFVAIISCFRRRQNGFNFAELGSFQQLRYLFGNFYICIGIFSWLFQGFTDLFVAFFDQVFHELLGGI